ncbi:MAG: class I SAM-dependent methyltransferase [Acidimicrobiales bacterium]
MSTDVPLTRLTWRSPSLLEIDGVEYDLMHESSGDSSRLRMLKTRTMIEGYGPMVAEFQSSDCVELGIFRGGSTAFLAQMLHPRRLVAMDISPDPVESLERFLRQRHLTEAVRTHYGVDQSDQAALAAIVTAEFGDGRLDLVIDDASHLYHPTVASFEVLFPRLRTGGLYVIEDWRNDELWFNAYLQAMEFPDSPHAEAINAGLARAMEGQDSVDLGPRLERLWVNAMRDPDRADHRILAGWYDRLRSGPPGSDVLVARLDQLLDDPRPPADTWTDEAPPLMALAAELLTVAAEQPDVVSSLTVDPHWISIRRGPAELDPIDFSFAELARDRMGVLARTYRSADHR